MIYNYGLIIGFMINEIFRDFGDFENFLLLLPNISKTWFTTTLTQDLFRIKGLKG